MNARLTQWAFMKVIVTSDQHLGYANSDKVSFNRFLDELANDKDLTHLVLLGDFVDMWRRDASGVFLEAHDTLAKILSLKAKGVNVFYVAGNHDYHVLKLEGSTYGFQFRPSYSFSFGNTTYIFKHGWEFDPEQTPFLMEALCHNFDNAEGADLSALWTDATNLPSDLKDLLEFHKTPEALAKHMLQPPEQRLQPGDVEKRAFASLNPGEKLVFGHTHRPFVSSDGRVANSGSWVTDAEYHNTYVELDGETMKLFTIDESENISTLSLVEDPQS